MPQTFVEEKINFYVFIVIYNCRLMVMLNSYDIVKEAFMTRADDFADRLMNETTFMDFTDGSYNRIYSFVVT